MESLPIFLSSDYLQNKPTREQRYSENVICASGYYSDDFPSTEQDEEKRGVPCTMTCRQREHQSICNGKG